MTNPLQCPSPVDTLDHVRAVLVALSCLDYSQVGNTEGAGFGVALVHAWLIDTLATVTRGYELADPIAEDRRHV